jgi:hypothetical protein
MMRWLPLIVLLVARLAVAGEVFRWVDENGQVQYSDRPGAGAEVVELPQAQTFNLPAASVSRRIKDQQSSSGAEDAADGFRYTNLGIVRPAEDEVFWNVAGEVNVSIQLQPELQSDHRVRLFLDGQLVDGLASSGLNFKLTEVVRGTHALRAEVQTSRGISLIESPSVVFTVQQTSIQNQNNPNVPLPSPTNPAR